MLLFHVHILMAGTTGLIARPQSFIVDPGIVNPQVPLHGWTCISAWECCQSLLGSQTRLQKAVLPKVTPFWGAYTQ